MTSDSPATYLNEATIRQFIAAALLEDRGEGPGSGDHSTLASVPANARRAARMTVKAPGIIAGLELARRIFHHLDPGLVVTLHMADGTAITPGQVPLSVEGAARPILTAERVVLNCVQRMSAIATLTRQAVEKVAGTKAIILDTRKTTPGFRLAEKWAVRIGGGQNHRFGLYDMMMLKDNHVDFAGGVRKALMAAHDYRRTHGLPLKIEIETRTLAEVEEALSTRIPDVIMLDNMDTATMRQAVAVIGGACLTEASGGITLDKLEEIAHTGVDFISIGALTHSAGSLDISLKAVHPATGPILSVR